MQALRYDLAFRKPTLVIWYLGKMIGFKACISSRFGRLNCLMYLVIYGSYIDFRLVKVLTISFERPSLKQPRNFLPLSPKSGLEELSISGR